MAPASTAAPQQLLLGLVDGTQRLKGEVPQPLRLPGGRQRLGRIVDVRALAPAQPPQQRAREFQPPCTPAGRGQDTHVVATANGIGA